MKTLLAFMRKEWLYQRRTHRLLFIALIFLTFGLMNPGITLATPALMNLLAETAAQSGMVITQVRVSAVDSWLQFHKNIPMALIAFLLLECGLFTREYRMGTLVPVLTRGLERRKVVAAKAAVLAALWTAGFWFCFGLTWGCNAVFWDNAAAANVGFSALCQWANGMLYAALTVLLSVCFSSNIAVLGGLGGFALLTTVLGFLPKIQEVQPGRLAEGAPLVYGTAGPAAYAPALALTAVLIAGCLGASIPVFNRKQL